ncbi:MAG TPA: DUF4954 family protein [Spirochaetota bacterium]|nr:DUF4954 family protein [Spirochaetota bacterium]HPI88701.1 DUF4954 family protein [Spirochaetota bacterium]HPR48777.1 DUF4954 family protein [Spirochaetota bacterium]
MNREKNENRERLGSSDLLKTIDELKAGSPSMLFNDNIRPLNEKEIETLEKQGNHSPDWSGIMVCADFTAANIRHSFFMGRCYLGLFTGESKDLSDGCALPSGIYHCSIADCEIAGGAALHRVGLISRYLINSGAVIHGTQTVHSSGKNTFGNGIDIPVGIETGGREVLSFAEMTMDEARAVALSRQDREMLSRYRSLVKEYSERISLGTGYIGKDARIYGAGEICDSCISDSAHIRGALIVKNSTILSSRQEQTHIGHGVLIEDSCVQWGSSVSGMAIVKSSLLMEYSKVENHGKVLSSIIGPNSEIGEGEVTSSLVGPSVGAHHQSLLIAALWPGGRGNVGYGANVGSNHTAKAPDQEIFCGEGVFFGLGVNIKFPSDFTQSPYSIIATGVDTLPQKVEYPFSLINKPSSPFPGVPLAYNEIIPAWVLTGNIFSIKRNEIKFAMKNRAKKNIFHSTIFRPDIVDMMLTARDRLKEIDAPRELYTAKDIPGLGKNYLMERNRKSAIDSYSFYIEYFALKELLSRVCMIYKEGNYRLSEEIYKTPSSNQTWEYARRLIILEGLAEKTLKENLARLQEISERITANIQRAKEKDDGRGKKIIADYSYSHLQAPDDPFVKEAWAEWEKEKKAIAGIIAGL